MKSEGALPADSQSPTIEVETPRDPTHGDLSSNAALVLAKPARMKPRDIAEKLKAKLDSDPDIAAVEVAGPGFLNLTMKPAFWQRLVGTILDDGGSYGRGNVGKGETVNVEYVSANPTGPMHVGHGRGAVFGDALRICSSLPATRSRASTMSMTPADRSISWHARCSCATARRWARISARSPQGSIRAII